KYDRLLRYVWRDDGLFYNDWIIRKGYAHEYTYDLPYEYQEQFKEAEKYARENELGLWSPTACTSPAGSTESQVSENIFNYGDNSDFTCNCNKSCDQITSCDEAYFQLNQCGCSRRDADSDGIPCETLCSSGIKSSLNTIEQVTQTQLPEGTNYSCNCSKKCDEISSCDEAYFQLNQCGCSKRDGDNDGIPCENIC
ncbi:MAG: thermonuclease family protein, partial [Nitrososphaeraceae archaeon]|nr:thermonuclease family protein [Nitrososphaeraceae archaeon]